MEQRLTMVTLGVRDVGRARKFYEGLGFVAAKFESDDIAFFQMGSTILGLYGRQALADDAGVENSVPGFSGVALAWNARSEKDVDATLDEVVQAGGRLVKAPQKVFWGGYSGYFADPDGHLWEVAYNPGWPMDDDGRVQLPG